MGGIDTTSEEAGEGKRKWETSFMKGRMTGVPAYTRIEIRCSRLLAVSKCRLEKY